ncbi:MAG: hypothetical protein RR034_04160 [Bacteroidales bacterium]
MKTGKKTSFIFLLMLPLFLSGQSIKYDKMFVDSATTMIWTGLNFSYQWPFGKMAQTFKGNFNIGTGINLKTNSNWTFDINFNYLFGSSIKSDQLFGDVVTSQGSIIDGNGYKATIYTEGRYWRIGAGFGKIIPVNRWRNSGIWLHTDFSYFRHKIYINDPDYQVPQLNGDYRKLYDQRSSGFCMSQFIGYLFMQRIRVASFYAGIEIYEMWTKPDRNYSFVEGATKDLPYKFSGMMIGWIVPLYEKKKVTTLYTF